MPPTLKPSACTAASFVHVSVVRIACAASAPPSGESAATACSTPASTPLDRQRHADHAGREDEHLLGSQPEEVRRPFRSGARVREALLARRSVRVPGVDDDGARLRALEVLLADDDRRRLDAVRREHRRADALAVAGDEREVGAELADPRGDAGGPEALRGGDAHTSTPASRSPAVSSKPSATFAFCTALPAAPLPRLSIAQTTIVAARRAVLVDARSPRRPCAARARGRARGLRRARAPRATPRTRPRAARAASARCCT